MTLKLSVKIVMFYNTSHGLNASSKQVFIGFMFFLFDITKRALFLLYHIFRISSPCLLLTIPCLLARVIIKIPPEQTSERFDAKYRFCVFQAGFNGLPQIIKADLLTSPCQVGIRKHFVLGSFQLQTIYVLDYSSTINC